MFKTSNWRNRVEEGRFQKEIKTKTTWTGVGMLVTLVIALCAVDFHSIVYSVKPCVCCHVIDL